MPKIFISHAWEDNEKTRKLAHNLTRDGANVWVYFSQIDFENQLPETSKEAMEWCDTFILIWSKHAATSNSVSLECQYALDLNKNIMQCLLDDTKRISSLQNSYYLDFRNFEKGYSNLMHFMNINHREEINHRDEIIIENIDEENRDLNKLKSTLIQFRGMPENLSEDRVLAMIQKYDFFDAKRNNSGLGIQTRFEIRELNSDKIVMDRLIGLMWQQSGSSDIMWYDNTKNWVDELNKNKYAGYSDWRLPTLEEAMSLMMRERKNGGYFINSLFDPMQASIWTSDLSQNALRAWVVFYNYGACYESCFDFNNYVRAVRSGNE